MSRHVRDPRTGRPERFLAPPTLGELKEGAARLRAAQPAWQERGAAGRAEVLRAWRTVLDTHEKTIVDALAADRGHRPAAAEEFQRTALLVAHWAHLAALLGDVPGGRGDLPGRPSGLPWVRVRSRPVPYPLVGVIGPYSRPLFHLMLDAVPALLAGCAVLGKPSELTPRFVGPLAAAIDEVPDLRGVLTVVEGTGNLGDAVVKAADAVAFTGSTTTGRKIAEAAARALVPAFLSLGRKDAAVVLEGADLPAAASAIARAGTVDAGQVCGAVERIYVHQRAHDEFVDLLGAEAGQIRLGHPDDTDGNLGPLLDGDQATVIARHLSDATSRGARIAAGEGVQYLGGGAWCGPVVLTRTDHTMLVMTEETFGPVLPVMAVDSPDQAVQLVNDSVYGGAAAVFGPDQASALAVADRLTVGTVGIGAAGLTLLEPDLAGDPAGASGLGASRTGAGSVRRFLRRRNVVLREAPPGMQHTWMQATWT